MKRILLLLTIVSVFSGTLVVTTYSQPLTKEQVRALASRAYSLVKSNPEEAAKLFEQVVELDPANRNYHEALGYVYLAREKFNRALDQFNAAQNIRHSDTLQLQIAFTLDDLHRIDEANITYRALLNSAATDIQEKARQQLSTRPQTTFFSPPMLPTSASSDWWTRIYFASYYDTRWETEFFSLTAEEGYRFPAIRTLSAFGVFGFSADTRSSAGLVPEIFSDNSLLFGVGIRWKPISALSLTAQEGAAFDMVGRTNIDFVRNDFRLVANYGWGIYAPFTLHSELRYPFSPIVDVYSSLGYYSRYENTIGYLQIKGGLRAVEMNRAVCDVYAKANFARDAAIDLFQQESFVKSKDYYNNYNEFGLGIRATPNIDWGLYFDAEVLRGCYSISSMVPADRDRYFTSFRIYLIYDRTF